MATACGPGLCSAGQAAAAQQDTPPSGAGPPVGAVGTETGAVFGADPSTEAREVPDLLQKRLAADGLAAAEAAAAVQEAAGSVKGAADACDKHRTEPGLAEDCAAVSLIGSAGGLDGAAGCPESVVWEGKEGAAPSPEKDPLAADSPAPAKAVEGTLAGGALMTEGSVEAAREEERHNLALAKDGAKVVRFPWTANLNASLFICIPNPMLIEIGFQLLIAGSGLCGGKRPYVSFRRAGCWRRFVSAKARDV